MLTKIMIVDDEEKTRNLIKICCNWKEIDCEIIREAESAQEALDLLNEDPVDIVITDIEMPHMNGLKLAKSISESYPHIKIIILTAHESFDYAKESIHIGVSDYIVKPIRREQLRHCVCTVKKQLDKNKELLSHQEKYHEEITKHKQYLRDMFINDLILGNISEDNRQERLDYYELEILSECSNFQISALEFITLNKTEERKNLLHYFYLRELLPQIFNTEHKYIICADHLKRILIIGLNPDSELELLAEHLTLILKQMGIEFCIGIGNSVHSLNELKRSYEEALEAIKYKSIFGNDCIINYNQTLLGHNAENIDSDKISDDLCFLVKLGDLEKAEEQIEIIFSQYVLVADFSIVSARFTIISCVIKLLKVIQDLGFEVNEFFQTNSLPVKYIIEIDNIPMLRNYLTNLVAYSIETIKARRNSHDNDLIIQIKNYLNEHYNDCEISLNKIANKYFVNQSFLCRIFKQETSVNFITYLTKLRIDKAIELLDSKKYRIYEIADMVGIPDANYFSKCFKKVTGLSISDFKSSG